MITGMTARYGQDGNDADKTGWAKRDNYKQDGNDTDKTGQLWARTAGRNWQGTNISRFFLFIRFVVLCSSGWMGDTQIGLLSFLIFIFSREERKPVSLA